MTNTEKLASTFLSLPSEARPTAARLLRQVAHDVQSPVSTLAMEVFSIRLLLGQLESASSGTSAARNSKVLADLHEISANMERASGQLSEYLNQLTSFEADSEEASLEGHDREHSDRR